MPHILIESCDITKNLKQLNIHAELVYKSDYFNTPKQRQLQSQILSELESVVQKYIADFESEELSNHDYNLRHKNF